MMATNELGAEMSERPESVSGGAASEVGGEGGTAGGPGQEGQRKRRRRRRGKRGTAQPGAPAGGGQEAAPQAGGQAQLLQVEGILDSEIRGPNAFLRRAEKNYLPTPDDPEVPKHLVQRLRLRPGARLIAHAQSKGKLVVQRIDTVDGLPPEQAWNRPDFSGLTVIDPVRRIRLETTGKESLTRVLDLISPIGFGQRALIVAPPKTGKTIMLQRIAQAISTNYPDAHLMVLLVDERPEEVTDMRRSIKGEVLASSSDRSSADHLKVAEMTLERAKRLVEQGKDVVILLDSITRLARAYNKEVESSGRTLSGGVDSKALEKPKRIFGAARNCEEGGSLTIIGTALIDTGSRMDEVIFEEFKGTGNMEVTLDRMLAEKRMFPAINIPQSGTRKEEKLFSQLEYDKVRLLRVALSNYKPVEAMEKLLTKVNEFRSNDEFLNAV
ncbi:transcription termination factor Rho [Vulgatibacter incomptus]|uniref:Transcription termination factor Rho n=1 Tax=Vulgatibacter incomptus TaxID=1391653 RepID=A0A0K1PF70_9BACT|nr:transcription termination factor Rho [Vulgatibacter incomptus]AKU92071.1 Transcription termination factor Rho [Vulgatibacter incomptus]